MSSTNFYGESLTLGIAGDTGDDTAPLRATLMIQRLVGGGENVLMVGDALALALASDAHRGLPLVVSPECFARLTAAELKTLERHGRAVRPYQVETILKGNR